MTRALQSAAVWTLTACLCSLALGGPDDSALAERVKQLAMTHYADESLQANGKALVEIGRLRGPERASRRPGASSVRRACRAYNAYPTSRFSHSRRGGGTPSRRRASRRSVASGERAARRR